MDNNRYFRVVIKYTRRLWRSYCGYSIAPDNTPEWIIAAINNYALKMGKRYMRLFYGENQ